jgi:hypothetical protein
MFRCNHHHQGVHYLSLFESYNVKTVSLKYSGVVNLLKTKRNLHYIRHQSITHRKHFPPRL